MEVFQSENSVQQLLVALEEAVPCWMSSSGVPGVSLALIRAGQAADTREFGLASTATHEAVTPETVFEAASLSKPVFSALCLQLCDAGILDLDLPLAGYLPEPYPELEGDPDARWITLRQVLSHTTGLPNWRRDGAQLRTHFNPGARFSYSGEAYLYLQAVVAYICGMAPHELVRQHLFQPFGMQFSGFQWTGEENLALAAGHDETGKPHAKHHWREMNAAAGLHTTPTDYARFTGAILRPPAGNPGYLSPAMSKAMVTPQVAVNDSAPWQLDWDRTSVVENEHVSWSLGWGIQHASWGDAVWHWGDNGNYQSFVLASLKGGNGLVVMTNGARGQWVIQRILYDLLNRDQPGMDWLVARFGY